MPDRQTKGGYESGDTPVSELVVPEVLFRPGAGSAPLPVSAVPDLPCPKCGGVDVGISYCDGCDLRPYTSSIRKHEDDFCAHGEIEHFHRACRRCSYRWKTDDVLNARKVCKQ